MALLLKISWFMSAIIAILGIAYLGMPMPKPTTVHEDITAQVMHPAA